jgi:rod shape-determining protein MreC
VNEFLKKKGIKLAAVVIIVAIIAGVCVRLGGGEAGFFSNAAGSAGTSVRKAVSAMSDWLESIYGYIYKYDQLVEENETLRAQLAEAQEKARLGQEATDENERLRALLELDERHSDFVYESAKIVSWTSSNWASTFTISKGSDSGIEVGDCVITAYGALVGQVIELGTSWATVQTLIDINTSVGVLVGEAGNAAMAVGDYTLMGDGLMKLTYLTEGTLPINGDTVLTSGKGGIFPQGLVVGTIYSVNTEAGGQTTYAVIQPTCDLDSLSQVFVIKDFDVVE